jgi:hypothetical protein
MRAKEVLTLREHRRGPDEHSRDRDDRAQPSFLRYVDQTSFQQGYIAGWQSVRGAGDQPIFVPPSPVFVGPMMYMVGFSRGVRDAEP